MKHETHDYTMEKLVNHLYIEEVILLKHKSISSPENLKANVVETSVKDDRVRTRIKKKKN